MLSIHDPADPKSPFTAAELIPGKNYRVVIAFTDYDGAAHAVGESWRFLKTSFSPYDDGLTLAVEQAGREVLFRLQWRAETQGPLVDHFSDRVEAC